PRAGPRRRARPLGGRSGRHQAQRPDHRARRGRRRRPGLRGADHPHPRERRGLTLDDLLLGLRVVLSLAAVLGALWFLQRRVARTQARRRDSEAITVLGRQWVGPKAQVVMIQTEDARYVLG